MLYLAGQFFGLLDPFFNHLLWGRPAHMAFALIAFHDKRQEIVYIALGAS